MSQRELPAHLDQAEQGGHGAHDGGKLAADRINQAEAPQREWVERGIINVPVNDLPYPEDIQGPADFKKIPEERMRDGLHKLELMKPYIESGEGANSDFWRQMDQDGGLAYDEGYQQVYDAFYGDDAIRLEKDGDSYDVINGRHRILLAKQVGMREIPASVTERQGS